MRFDRGPRPEGYRWTARKEAMYLRREAREVEKIARDYPLFVGQFQPPPTRPVDEERARRECQLRESEQRWRALMASQWRRVRREYFACTPALRAAILEEWNRWRGPARPVYFTTWWRSTTACWRRSPACSANVKPLRWRVSARRQPRRRPCLLREYRKP